MNYEGVISTWIGSWNDCERSKGRSRLEPQWQVVHRFQCGLPANATLEGGPEEWRSCCWACKTYYELYPRKWSSCSLRPAGWFARGRCFPRWVPENPQNLPAIPNHQIICQNKVPPSKSTDCIEKPLSMPWPPMQKKCHTQLELKQKLASLVSQPRKHSGFKCGLEVGALSQA